MINAAISHLAAQLNQFFRTRYQQVEDLVVVSNLVELDGNVVAQANNKLVLMLVNIEKDSLPHRQGAGNHPSSERRGLDNRLLVHSAPLHLNLYLMMAANFGGANYAEALKYISAAISFFQANPVFDPVNSPDLHRGIEKLILDIENLKIQDLNNLWSLLGGKYLPSVYYKMRMITLDGTALIGQVPQISDVNTTLAREG